MLETRELIHSLNAIADKHAYTHKLGYELCLGKHEFMERKFYELCFVLYVRFQMEKLSPQIIYKYFNLLQKIIREHNELQQDPNIQSILHLGTSLQQFNDHALENFQFTNIMLKINYHVNSWQSTHHICKYCGHSLDLLTQDLKALPKKRTRSRQK